MVGPLIEQYIGKSVEINGREWVIAGYVEWSEQYVELVNSDDETIIRPMTVLQPHLTT